MIFDASEDALTLNAHEVRVLGCLIEKELSTPDYYPMTVNALKAACNQKTNRDPVVEYDTSAVLEAVEGLQRRRLVGHATSTYGRADKYRHALAEMMGLDRSELALLSSLMLRGPQTTGELRARTSRMHEFGSLEAVESVLGALSSREPPLAVHLTRRPGQKESRFAHLFAGEPDEEDPTVQAHAHGDLEGRVGTLEEKLEMLQQQVDELTDAFESFRRAFE